MTFIKAEKRGIRGRIAHIGPTGSGKTFWSLQVATRLAKVTEPRVPGDSRFAVIDSEQGSAKKYADIFNFDVFELHDDYAPQRYVKAIKEAAEIGYGVLVIDSLSHAWSMHGGLLEQVDNIAARSRSTNRFIAWRDATPIHNQLVDAILEYPGHVIVTMRSKMEYLMEKDNKGSTTVKKVGMQPVQRDGLEYEFDFCGDVQIEGHSLVMSKSRCPALADKVFRNNEADKYADMLVDWLGDQGDVPKVEAPKEDTPRVPGVTESARQTPSEYIMQYEYRVAATQEDVMIMRAKKLGKTTLAEAKPEKLREYANFIYTTIKEEAVTSLRLL